MEMTVAQLVAKLQELDQSRPVYVIVSGESSAFSIVDALQDIVQFHRDDKGGLSVSPAEQGTKWPIALIEVTRAV